MKIGKINAITQVGDMIWDTEMFGDVCVSVMSREAANSSLSHTV